MRFLRYALILAALLAPSLASAQTLNQGYQQPYLNITGPNRIDGVTVNATTPAAGSFTTLTASSASSFATTSGGVGIGTANTGANAPLQVIGLGTSAPIGTQAASYVCVDTSGNFYRKATCP